MCSCIKIKIRSSGLGMSIKSNEAYGWELHKILEETKLNGPKKQYIGIIKSNSRCQLGVRKTTKRIKQVID